MLPPKKSSGAQRQVAFVTAQRHSRLVRALKIVVPAAALLMAGAFVAATYVLTPAKVNIDTDGSAYVDGKLVMANPKLEGFTKDNRPYSMTAVRAIQDLGSQSVIELEEISARMPVDENDWFSVVAPKGTYDRTANTLNMTSPFQVKTTGGMTAELASAFIDIGKGDLRTDRPVKIELNGTRVEADSLTVYEKGKVLVFQNRVRMNIESSRLQKIRSDAKS